MPIIIVVPLIAVLLIVVAAMVIKMTTPPPAVVVTKPTEFPNAIKDAETGKPSTFLGSLFGQKAPTPTPSPATANDLSRQLKDTYDDGGQADLNAIAKDASSL